MPDKFNFDDLPHWGQIEMRCIVDGCEAHGPMWEWTAKKRQRHHEQHVRDRKRATEARLRRENTARLRQINAERRLEQRMIGSAS